MVCCSASEQVLRPIIIFERNWPSRPYSRKGPDGCLYGKSPNGYMDEELFLTWFEEIFAVGTSHAQPTLLIIDGHGSHISYSVIKRGMEENIIILLPPHTTNVIQLLDVDLFRSLTGDYQNINKTNFTAILKGSFERSMSLPTRKNGFRKTGVYPFNSEMGLIPMAPSLSSTPPISTSTLPGAAKMESTPTENLEKSKHDFTIHQKKPHQNKTF